jgi:hypothetical protein
MLYPYTHASLTNNSLQRGNVTKHVSPILGLQKFLFHMSVDSKTILLAKST